MRYCVSLTIPHKGEDPCHLHVRFDQLPPVASVGDKVIIDTEMSELIGKVRSREFVYNKDLDECVIHYECTPAV